MEAPTLSLPRFLCSSAVVACVVVFVAGCPVDVDSNDAGVDAGVVVDDGGCPDDLPDDCVEPAPVYADVEAVFAVKCAGCHGPGGVEDNKPLDTYDHVFRRRGAVLGQLINCLMPLPDAGVADLDADERQVVLHWLACNAPE